MTEVVLGEDLRRWPIDAAATTRGSGRVEGAGWKVGVTVGGGLGSLEVQGFARALSRRLVLVGNQGRELARRRSLNASGSAAEWGQVGWEGGSTMWKEVGERSRAWVSAKEGAGSCWSFGVGICNL